MLDSNNIFTIDIAVVHSELEAVYKEIIKNLNGIKTIEIKGDDDLQTSSLISLLVSIKNSKPDISIPLIDHQNSFLKGLGKFSILK